MSSGRTGCLDPAVINEEDPFSWVGHLEGHHLNPCWEGRHRGLDLGGRHHLDLEKDR